MHAGLLTSFAVQGISEAHDRHGRKWFLGAAKAMREIVDTFKDVTVVEPLVTIRSTMKDSDRKTMEALATAIAEA